MFFRHSLGGDQEIFTVPIKACGRALFFRRQQMAPQISRALFLSKPAEGPCSFDEITGKLLIFANIVLSSKPAEGPCSFDKTNSQFEIGRKVILDYALESGYGGSHWRITTHWDQKFIALENVFAMLDRKLKAQAPKTHYSALSNAVRESGPDCHGATDLFEFKGYKRGTLHLTFRRPDLVARLNATAGGNRLKPK